MCGDSFSRGCRFKSQHQILDGHFLHNVEICLTFVRKRPEKQKEAVNGPLKSIRVVKLSALLFFSFLTELR